MMRYALAKPRFLKTSMTLAAVMVASLLLASSALAWTTLATTTPSTSSSLNAATCTGNAWIYSSPVSTDCYAWGNYTVASGATTGAGALIGTNLLGTYSLGSAPSGSSSATIRGADCRLGCAQVGENKGFAIATGSNLSVPLAPAGAVTSRLNAVSCITGNSCVAVGQYTDSAAHSHGYVAVRSGPSTWSVTYQYQPTETLGESALNGVSCLGSRCLIVGTHTGGTGPLPIALIYTLSSGAVTTAAISAGTGGFRQLNGISCVDNFSQTKCEAVGSYKATVSGPTIPLYLQSTFALGSTGAVTYTTEPGTPAAPAAATTTRLNGASCYWDSVRGFGCRVVGDSDATGSVQPYLGTLTTAAVSASGGSSATATGTSCFDTGPSARCYDVGTSTASGVTQAIYNNWLL
jgi:hypothetical protein